MPRPDRTDTITPRVLIADNDAGVSAVLSQVLSREGLAVEIAADGRIALERIRHGGLQLLVCDLDMPHLGGEEVLAALHGIAGAPQAVVISGYLDASTNGRLLGLPKVRVTLRKPFDVFAFGKLVGGLCRGAELRVPAGLAGRIQVASREEAAGA